MARPMFDQGWYFAGEHTSQIYRGSVHGALLTGVHAADYITSEVKEDEWYYMDAIEDEDENAGEEEEEGEAAEEEDNKLA